MTTTTYLNQRLDGDDGEPPVRRGVPHRGLILATAACVVVGALIVWLVAFSSLFGVRTVKVAGLQNLTSAQVIAAAGMSHGTPLVRLDVGAVQRRVEAMPDVASAHVSTSFPSTVSITVTERVAVGAIKVGGGYVLVDKTGDQYRTTTARPAGLPLFVVPPGTSSKTTGGAVATVAVALGAPLRAQVNSIQALDPQAITVLMANGTVVAWGSADQSTLKARIVVALLAHSGQHQIDVSDPSAPFTR
jgi:cell division protein FtsQ